ERLASRSAHGFRPRRPDYAERLSNLVFALPSVHSTVTVTIMTKRFLPGIIVVLLAAWPASAASISVSAPALAGPGGLFDVAVQPQDLFAGRDPSTDGIFGFGFDVTANPSTVLFLGADAGPLFEAPVSLPEADVFSQALGFGLFPPLGEPLLLATLHFRAAGTNLAQVSITSDLTNFFQGLQFFNEPVQETIAGSASVAVPGVPVPEPATIGLIGLGLLGIGGAKRQKPRTRLPRVDRP